ncbi:hypothetical protein Tco_0144519 [Tanacetum coccineum]
MMWTKTELTREQSQQGASDEVLSDTSQYYSDDGNPTSANIKQALWQIKLFGVLENSLLINTSTDSIKSIFNLMPMGSLTRVSGHRKAEHELMTQSGR